MPSNLSLVITCEHAGNEVPPEYADLFSGQEELLQSHRGYDIGALELAAQLHSAMKAPLIYTKITRLLVETNRSDSHPQVFSKITKSLDQIEKQKILDTFYYPHRRRVIEAISERIDVGNVLHLGVHTFTPELDGEVRNADIGLLYDPARKREKDFCECWKQVLLERGNTLRVRMNYPYLGKADGLTTTLRKMFLAEKYLGIEIEVNQRFALEMPEAWEGVKEGIVGSLIGMSEGKHPCLPPL